MFIRNAFNFKHRIIDTIIVTPIMVLISQFLNPLLLITKRLDLAQDLRTLHNQNQDSTFDYIIVGAGSAGSILASRLSENASIRVLVLEAGGIPSPILGLPVISFGLNNKKSYDWAHRTVPQREAARGLNDRVCYWPAGKVLGGSSGINGLIYIRGNVQGYDQMAKRTNDSIWKTENIMKFYKKVENYKGWFSKGGTHGVSGDLDIEVPGLVPLTKHLLQAGEEMGYKIRDPNAKNALDEGFAPVEFYMKKGVRQDTYRATLKRIMDRENLVIRKYSFVTRLLFSPGSRNEVIGVEYERHGRIYFAKATRETILSSGALGSPKILMLSGIGPKEHLEQLKIPVRADLPVGQRLQDKYGAFVGPFVVKRGYSFHQFRDINITSFLNWVATGKGLISSGRTESTFAILSDLAKASKDTFAPDIHSYMLSYTSVPSDKLFKESFNFKEEVVDYMVKSAEYGDTFFQFVALSRPSGTGTLKLTSKNPHNPLEIDPKYLHDPHDVKVLVEGIKFAVKLAENTKAMKETGAYLYNYPFPGCESHPFKSDSYYECIGRHWTFTAYKYCGTASVGTKDDPVAVVDSRFRVFKTRRLRVIDGSLLRMNEVNTNDVTMRMIGEFGAEVIKMSAEAA